MLLAALRAAHELLIELSFLFHCSMDSVHYSFCEFKVYGYMDLNGYCNNYIYRITSNLTDRRNYIIIFATVRNN